MENMERKPSNFIEEFIVEDLASGRCESVHTRFPPEPNGYLHIGHAKALCIDFGTAEKFGGVCNLRFDDTNPTKEDAVFVDGIRADIEWLGYKWHELHFASDFFEQAATKSPSDLIRKGVAYVDDQSPEEMRKNRGTLTKPGVNSPYRDRSVEENLDLFRRMKDGRVPGRQPRAARQDRHGLPQRAHARPHALPHPAHATITAPATSGASIPCTTSSTRCRTPSRASRHSLCSLEYEIHRPLYDWVVAQAGFDRPSAAPDRVRPPEHHPHDHEQALPAPPGGRGRVSPAGTIRACPP